MAPRKSSMFQRILQLVLDRKTAMQLQRDTQDALRKGTDPKAAKQNLGTVAKAMAALRAVAIQLMGVFVAAFSIRQLARYAGAFENALSTIRRETGDTGEALAQLNKDLRATLATGPEGIEEVAVAIATLRTQTGLLGAPLQALTRQVLDFARVTGTDARSAATITGQLLSRLGLEAEAASGLLDRLTVAGQQTGVSIDALAQGLLRGSDSLAILGLSINQQIALLAQIEKRGGDVTQTARALNTAIVSLAREGVTDGAEAFQLLLAEIQSAPSDFAAAERAAEVFGARVGPTLAADIRAGRLNIEELTGALQEADGALASTTAESRTLQEEIRTAANQLNARMLPALNAVTQAARWFLLWTIRVADGLAFVTSQTFHRFREGLALIEFGLIRAELALRKFFRLDTSDMEERLRAVQFRIIAIRQDIERSGRSAEEAGRNFASVFDEVREAAQGTAEAIALTTEEIRKLEDARISLLAQGLKLGQLTLAEKTEILARHHAINAALEAGNLTLEERVRLTTQLATLSESIASDPWLRIQSGTQDFSRAGPRQQAGEVILPDVGFSPRQIKEGMQDVADAWMRQNEAMVGAAQRAALGIANAFAGAFTAIRAEGGSLGAGIEALFRGVAGSALGALADVAATKVVENVAWALEQGAKAAGALANPLTAWMAPGHAASAKGHWAAAGKWALIGGGAAAGQSAIGGSSSGGLPTGARDPMGRGLDTMGGLTGPDINLYFDGVDPDNPRHQALIGDASRKYQQRYGGRIVRR